MSSEDWNEHREEIRLIKIARMERELPAIMELQKIGFKVRKLTEYQFRINEQLDVYPSTGRWVLLRSPRTGKTENLSETAREILGAQISTINKPIEWRIWNLKTADWASTKIHTRNSDCLTERINRIAAADSSVKELARQALLMMRVDNIAYRERRQRIFDQRYPQFVAKRK